MEHRSLKSYISESLFDKDTEKKISKTRDEVMFDLLKKCTYDDLPTKFPNGFSREWGRKLSPWERGEVILGNDGRVNIKCLDLFAGLTIYDAPRELLDWLRFGEVKIGSINFQGCKEMKDFGKIFSKVKFNDYLPSLLIYGNPNLTSLRGLPEKTGSLYIYHNPRLLIYDGPKDVFGDIIWRDNGEHLHKQQMLKYLKKTCRAYKWIENEKYVDHNRYGEKIKTSQIDED